MRYLKQINEGLEKPYKNIKRADSKLSEAMPRELMPQIKRTDAYGRRGSNDNKGYGKILKDWQGNQVTGIKDFENASYEEVTPSDVLAMRKRGEDLSSIYTLTKGGKLLKLNAAGQPDQDNSTAVVRANQSLKTTLADAKKIYKIDLKDLIDSDPEKAHARLGNLGDGEEAEERRQANLRLGHNRPDDSYWDKSRRSSEYVKKIQNRAGNSKEIAAIQAEYEAGDISRKEMEKRISDIQNSWRSKPDKYDIDTYNGIRNRNAENRYIASAQTLQKPFKDLESARSDLRDAKYSLQRSQQKLNNIKSNNTSGDTWGSDYLYAKEKVDKLTQQIADLQKDLEYYQNQINNGAQAADIKKYEDSIAREQAIIDKSQAQIDRLLRRTESLIKKSNKRLNEGYVYVLSWKQSDGKQVSNQRYTAEHISQQLKDLEKYGATDIELKLLNPKSENESLKKKSNKRLNERKFRSIYDYIADMQDQYQFESAEEMIEFLEDDITDADGGTMLDILEDEYQRDVAADIEDWFDENLNESLKKKSNSSTRRK